MSSMRLLILTLTLLFATGSGMALSGDTDDLKPSSDDRCAVCGMSVAPYPEWTAVVAFSDGSRYFFDGPKDLFSFFFSLEQYRPEGTPGAITAVRVTEYYTTRQMPAGEVFFVAGSDVLGPMGQELVPVAGEEAVRTFLQDHGGSRVMRFNGSELEKVDTLP